MILHHRGLLLLPTAVPPALGPCPALPCRDKPSRPFRCLDPQYRRELVRVYLTNVENICRRFCEDKRARLAWARDSTSFRQFWGGLGAEQQRKLLTERGDVLLKVGAVGRGQGCWHSTAEGNGREGGIVLRVAGAGRQPMGRAPSRYEGAVGPFELTRNIAWCTNRAWYRARPSHCRWAQNRSH